ncbi:MAG: phosphoenolpyruvate-utilizing protein [Actinobacteria bacterium]|nr:phosphoenolpyruvate-utilizing protein [Actinomycetota bacterium]MBV9254247.1 phosphoenolpyruvate-utilizing protein [Actinomycetota bacterium]
MERIWAVDNEPSQRYPIYTRGNVGEVFPEAVAPLSWTLGAIPGAETGWRDALERFGAFDLDEFNPDEIECLGCFGGYAYLNVSISRILAIRTPGLTPELMDQSLFGTSEAPPYQPRPTDESPAHTGRINETIGWILTQEDLPELVDDQRMVDETVRNRPDFASMSNEAVVAHAKSHMQGFRHLFGRHLFITYCSTVPLGIIQGVCTELGDPTMAMRLVAGIGGVDSAAPSWALWDLARQVRASSAITAQFDQGVDGLLERLRADADGVKFCQAFDEFLEQFGSRGPNEWEMRAPTWGTRPELALGAIERMRHAGDDAAPQLHFDERAADRQALADEITPKLAGDPETQGQFVAALRAAGIFLAGRERSKTTVIKFVHESRLAFTEIGKRMVAAGVFDEVEDFGLLTAAEYDDFLTDPMSFRDTIRERATLYERLQGLEPPFIVNGVIPPLDEWKPRGSTPVPVAGAGDVLAGIPGCPGSYTGRARVVLSPDDPRDLDPGDVLVAPITDPAWTPLFVPAGAVVVDVGAQISHAVIVSRELGIPCVVSVLDGTRRIPDGATITVDGTAGTVTVH